MNFLQPGNVVDETAGASSAEREIAVLKERVDELEHLVRLLIFDLVERQEVPLLPELVSEGEKV